MLQERYGFKCGCPRCQLDARHSGVLGSFTRAAHHRVSAELRPRFMAALEAQDRQAVDEVAAALQVR